MIGVISLLGMQGLQDSLHKKLGRNDISFLCGDCQNAATLLLELERASGECDIILLSSSAIRGTSIDSVLGELRMLSSDVRIVLILSGMRKQYVNTQLDEFKKQYLVSDIIFEGNGIDLSFLASIIAKGKMTKNEVLTGSELREEYEVEKENFSHNTTIGVFGTTHGAGVTNMVFSLAEYLTAKGFCVKAVDLTGTSSLSFAKGKAIYLTEKRQDLKEVKATCDFAIYDFGVPFIISSKGDYLGMAPEYSLDRIHELKQCSLKIVMGLMDDWNIGKTQYFWQDEKWQRHIRNDYVFLFDRDPVVIRKFYGHINMFYRNDKAFADIIKRIFVHGGAT